METVKIVLFSVLAAVGYGIIHDQVTAHLCVEYFTVAHPPIFPTASPFLLALGWGVIATWWVGLPLGLGAAAAARIGTRHKLGFAEIRPIVLWLLVVMAVCAVLVGAATAYLVATGRIPVPGGWGPYIPQGKWIVFSADAGAHLASYVVGGLGGLFLIGRIIWLRLQPNK
jgi:hypothetical protein